jgi:phage gpG-like protein
MAIDLTIQWIGVDAPSYARRFRRAAVIPSFAPVLKQIAVLAIAPAIEKNFAAQGRPKWAPLTEETIKSKMRKGFQSPGTILVATGALRDTATNPGNYVITNDSIIAEPGVPYWSFHQTGTSKMPQRVIMNLQIGDQRKIGGLFDRFILDHLAKHGLGPRGVMTSVTGGSDA